MINAVCPICNSEGRAITKETPHGAGIGWDAPGTNKAWIVCPACGFEGHHVVMAQDEKAAEGSLWAIIGNMAEAVDKATEYFNAGRGARRGGTFPIWAPGGDSRQCR